MSTELANAIRAKAAQAREAAEDLDGAAHDQVRDVCELARTLARVIEGQNAVRALGSPGDWGYETPIGKAIYAVLKAGTA